MDKQDVPATELAAETDDEALGTGEAGDQPGPATRAEVKRRLGIGGKLMLSFGVVALLTVVASGVAWVSFGQTERALRSITEMDMPAMIVAQELAENSAQLAVALPAVHEAETIGQLDERMTALGGLADVLQANIDDLTALTPDEQRLPGLQQSAGGLADSVQDSRTGFVFEEPTGYAFREALHRGLHLWRADRASFRRVQEAGMRQDLSWGPAADRYLEVYRRALAG